MQFLLPINRRLFSLFTARNKEKIELIKIKMFYSYASKSPFKEVYIYLSSVSVANRLQISDLFKSYLQVASQLANLRNWIF